MDKQPEISKSEATDVEYVLYVFPSKRGGKFNFAPIRMRGMEGAEKMVKILEKAGYDVEMSKRTEKKVVEVQKLYGPKKR